MAVMAPKMASEPTFQKHGHQVFTRPVELAGKQAFVETVQEIKDDVDSHVKPSYLPATVPSKAEPALFVTGLGHQYPPYLFHPDKLEEFLSKWYDIETPGMQKLLQVNQSTIIHKRPIIKAYEDPFWNRSVSPTIDDLDVIFRKAGVDLSVQACKKAIREAGCSTADITHLVATTCTNAGSPGYDLLVAQKLGLSTQVDRTLIHGTGCAGGLSAMRAAAAMAQSATVRGRPARVLVVACDICSTTVRCDLEQVVQDPDTTRISSALFSDGSAAFVLCNELAPGAENKAVYKLIDWETARIPETSQEIELLVRHMGFQSTLTKEVPKHAVAALVPMFDRLMPYLPQDTELAKSGKTIEPKDFDWALHPGGIAIIEGAQQKLELNEDQLRATFEIYKNNGNSSSPTVLVILDQLRKMGQGRENVISCSFGPGMTVEMCLLQRCRRGEEEDDEED